MSGSSSRVSSSSEDTDYKSISPFFEGDFGLFFKVEEGAIGPLAPPIFVKDVENWLLLLALCFLGAPTLGLVGV